MQARSCTRGECESQSAQCHPWIHAGCPVMCISDRNFVSNYCIEISKAQTLRHVFRIQRGHPCFLGCTLESHLNGNLDIDFIHNIIVIIKS